MTLVNRHAVRAILLTPQSEILLMRIRNPGTNAEFWICPGGGMKEGEDLAACLRRELAEELGLLHFEAHLQLHKRHHTFQWKEERIAQGETFFVVHVEKFEPVISDPEEAAVLQEFRWWPLAALDSAKHPITPRSLQKIVADYLVKGPPKGPLVVDTQVD